MTDNRFEGVEPFEPRVPLAIPTVHEEEQQYVAEAFKTGWVTTAGACLNAIEKDIPGFMGRKYGVALSAGTAALHLAVRLAGEKLYGQATDGKGTLEGKKVFCSDLTFDATVNPVAYEGGKAVFIDSEYETWNMDPEALAAAFGMYPEVKLVVMVHLYGTPAKIDEIRKICNDHNALLIEDAAESFGATYNGSQTGTFGDASVISFNGNKIITGSSGGMLLTDREDDANKIRKWSTQAREAAPWYQHEELGYNYRMSNIIASVVRGQFTHLEEHIAKKRAIYNRYKDGLKDLPVKLNPYEEGKAEPNFWLSCLLIDKEAMSSQVRSEKEYLYLTEDAKTCPQEILDILAKFRAEGRPIWKPMHMQPYYRMNPFITKSGNGRANSNAYIRESHTESVSEDIFNRGLCLPSDISMTEEQQDIIIDIIRRCFNR